MGTEWMLLVALLGSPKFTEREAAFAKLEKADAAIVYLLAGAKSHDAETAARCELLLVRHKLPLLTKEFSIVDTLIHPQRGWPPLVDCDFIHQYLVDAWIIKAGGDAKAATRLFCIFVLEERGERLVDVLLKQLYELEGK